MWPRNTLIFTLVILAASTQLLGCVTLDTPYDPSFFDQQKSISGNNTFVGKAFSKTGGGMIISTAGETAHLWPVHPYTTEWWNKRTTEGWFAQNIDQRIYSSSRQVKVDDNNIFKFKNVPDGQYYVWIQMMRYIGRSQEILFWGAKIDLKGGVTKKLILKVY